MQFTTTRTSCRARCSAALHRRQVIGALAQQPRALLQQRQLRQPALTLTAAATGHHSITAPCSLGFGVSSPTRGFFNSAAASSKRRCCRPAALPPLAMINVDFASPSLVLGITLIGCGIALLQVRNMQREVSRDADIVVAAMISIVGSTLIFQGWRLDPLLLLCQALTTSVAFWYGLETFKLRAQMTEEQDVDIAGQLPPPEGFNQNSQMPADPYVQATRSGYLPPAADRQMPPWDMTQQQQQQQPGFDASSSRWGLPPAPEQQYDYCGQPLGQQQQQQQPLQPQQVRQPEELYAQYGDADMSPWLQQQQQPYGGAADMLGGFGSSLYGQQQEPFGAPGGSSSMPADASQAGWYNNAAAGYNPEQQQQQLQILQYGSVPGAGTLPTNAAANAAQYGSPGLLQDGSAAAAVAGGYVAANETGPLPLPPAGQQQQRAAQQRGSRAGPGAYERVDDWE